MRLGAEIAFVEIQPPDVLIAQPPHDDAFGAATIGDQHRKGPPLNPEGGKPRQPRRFHRDLTPQHHGQKLRVAQRPVKEKLSQTRYFQRRAAHSASIPASAPPTISTAATSQARICIR